MGRSQDETRISMDDEPQVRVYPSIVRDAFGNVQRGRTIAVVDVIPNGKTYQLTISVEDIPASMMPPTTLEM